MNDLETTLNAIWGSAIAENVTAKRLTLTVEVQNPAWAAQLGFLQEKLKATCAENGLPIDAIDIVVRRVSS